MSAKRLTKTDLVNAAQDWAKRHGEVYGEEKGQVSIKTFDARLAPFVWGLVRYTEHGGALRLIGPEKISTLYRELQH